MCALSDSGDYCASDVISRLKFGVEDIEVAGDTLSLEESTDGESLRLVLALMRKKYRHVLLGGGVLQIRRYGCSASLIDT